MTVDPRKFLLNTDYEMDKIIFFTSGSIKASEMDKTIDHTLGFAPLVFGVCAFSESFNDPRTIPYNYSTQSNTIAFNIQATSTQIKISYANYNDQNTPIYYRIYAFEPSTSSARILPTGNLAKKFILNTDYNYCKLCKKGTMSGNGQHSVSHNLGYIPQTLIWAESSGTIIPIDQSNSWYDPILNEPFGVQVTNSQVISDFPATANYDTIHYRIYYDEA